jgi:RNA polymerase sigma-70 factor (ECF subfamily)
VPELSEKQQSLLRDAVGGNRTALQQLLLEYYQHIEASVRSRFNAALAGFVEPEDLIQEVLIKVHRSIGTYHEHEHGSFEAWLRAITRNCLIDVVRRNQRSKRGGQMRRIPLHPTAASDSLDTIWDWICQDSQLPDWSVRRKEARQALQVCLSQLPRDQCEVVVAHYFEHLDTTEIAARINRTPGAVRELLRRAREQLRELMGTASIWLSNR